MNNPITKFTPKTMYFMILLALIIPISGLGYSWFSTHQTSKLGADWDIAVQGYDPRDLLRGHYIRYEYDWQQYTDEQWNRGEAICIEGKSPKITKVSQMGFAMNEEDTKKCDSVIRRDKWNIDRSSRMTRDRLYIPQTKSVELEEKLRDRALRGIVTARIREDGKITPLTIRFEPIVDNRNDQGRIPETKSE